jgi:putative oxidoreductase
MLNLAALDHGRDLSQLGLRLLTGSFLMHETLDNIVSPARMQEFVAFMTQFGFPAPNLMAPLGVWVQFISGALLVLGLFTRWAGLAVAATFVVAVAMVHFAEPYRGWWPAIVLVFIGAHFATHGAGRWSVDGWRAK